MELLDRRFKDNKLRYVLQCLLAAGAVLVLLVVLDGLHSAAILAALGASSFIVFTMPHTRSARPRYLIGGYLVGIAAGALCHWAGDLLPDGQPLLCRYGRVAAGSASVALAIFVMVVVNVEHPPAASLALGLVLDEWSLWTVTVVMVGIVGLCAIRRALRRVLVNLL